MGHSVQSSAAKPTVHDERVVRLAKRIEGVTAGTMLGAEFGFAVGLPYAIPTSGVSLIYGPLMGSFFGGYAGFSNPEDMSCLASAQRRFFSDSLQGLNNATLKPLGEFWNDHFSHSTNGVKTPSATPSKPQYDKPRG